MEHQGLSGQIAPFLLRVQLACPCGRGRGESDSLESLSRPDLPPPEGRGDRGFLSARGGGVSTQWGCTHRRHGLPPQPSRLTCLSRTRL